MEKYSVRVLDENEFSAIRCEWNALLASSRSNNVFLTWEWQFTWWRHFHNPTRELMVLSARDRYGALKGIFPLFRERENCLEGDGTLYFLGIGETCSEFLDLFVASENEREIQVVLLKYVLEETRYRTLKLTDIPFGTSGLSCLEHILQEMQVSYVSKEGEICPFLELPETLDDFYKMLKPNMRSNYRRSMKKIQEASGKILQGTGGEEGVQSDFEALFLLHEARFKRKDEKSKFLSGKMREFHLDVGKLFKEQGWLKFFTIEIQDKVVGSLYCFVYGDKMSYYQAGFDPKYENLSLGIILLGKAMEDAIERKLKEFDFLRGAEAYKWHWTNTYRRTVRFTAYSRNLPGRLKCRYDRIRDGATGTVKVMMGKSTTVGGLKDKRFVSFHEQVGETEGAGAPPGDSRGGVHFRRGNGISK